MAISCIPKSTANEIKRAFREKEIDIKELYDMSSKERMVVFEKYASTELAKQINVNFEKAKVQKQMKALKEWIEKTTTAKEKKVSSYGQVLERIKELEETGALTDLTADGFARDLVAAKLGVEVTPEQVVKIKEHTDVLTKEFNKETKDGIPSIEYWKARKQLDDYLNSLSPSSDLAVFTKVAGRGAMLTSLKSPTLNIESNTINGAIQALERRLSNFEFKTSQDSGVIEYVKKVNDIYQKSGFDISRMINLEQPQVRLGEEITSAQGKGPIKQVGRFYEDIVFKQLMGAPDVLFSALAFADSINIASMKIAKGNKSKATALFNDAIRIEPKTTEGKILREQGIADARLATFTNDGNISSATVAIRNILDNATGSVALGTQLMPFVKTPANVVELGLDMAGLGFAKAGTKVIRTAIEQGGFWKIPEAWKKMGEGDGALMKDVVRSSVRSGVGMTLAYVLASMVDPDDFVGAYDVLTQKSRDLAKIKNAPYNSVRIGDKWVSLDYLGPLGSAFVGIMYAKKYGTNIQDTAFHYLRGVGSQALQVPGMRDFSDMVDNLVKTVTEVKPEKVGEGTLTNLSGYVGSRVIPAIVSDISNATDIQRETNGTPWASIQNKIPFVRKVLEPKINQLTGEEKQNENFFSVMFFGARVKTADTTPIVMEFNRLASVGETPTISDISYSSKKMKELEKVVSPKEYQNALEYYGKQYSQEVNDLIQSDYYKDLTDDEKNNAINDIRKDVLKSTTEEFGIEE